MMRRVALVAVAAAAAAGLAACGSSAAPSASGRCAARLSCTYAGIQSHLYQHGVLTVATDKPAYPPWFENNNPANGKGYESAVAYAIAKQLGFKPAQVHWAYEPFDASYAPGPKKFDFDINEISYTAQRATAVSFSSSYYDVQQALVALKGSPIATKHSPAQLKTYVYGDQIGTTSLAFITGSIQPTSQPKVFSTLNDVKQALQTNQIAAFVTDTPTAQYISSSEIPHSEMVAQFPSTGEHYGLLFSKGNPLVSCVNKAIATLKSERHAGGAAEAVPPDLPDRSRPSSRSGHRHYRSFAMTGSQPAVAAGSRGYGPEDGRRCCRRAQRGLAGGRLRRRRAAGRGCCPAAAAGPASSPRSARWSCWPPWSRSSWRRRAAAGPAHVLRPARHVAVLHRQSEEGLLLGRRGHLAEHPDVPGGRGPDPHPGPGHRPDPAVHRAGAVPAAGARDDLRGLLPRRAAAARGVRDRLRPAGAAADVASPASRTPSTA